MSHYTNVWVDRLRQTYTNVGRSRVSSKCSEHSASLFTYGFVLILWQLLYWSSFLQYSLFVWPHRILVLEDSLTHSQNSSKHVYESITLHNPLLSGSLPQPAQQPSSPSPVQGGCCALPSTLPPPIQKVSATRKPKKSQSLCISGLCCLWYDPEPRYYVFFYPGL
jgi:hypothetical protein